MNKAPSLESHSPSSSRKKNGLSRLKRLLVGGGRLAERIPFLRKVSRGTWLSLSFASMLLASFGAYTQVQVAYGPLWSPPFSVWSSVWWTTPMVFGGNRQLPVFQGALNGIAIEDEKVWVVGDGGFVAYTPDGGRCWTRLDYVSSTSDPDFGGLKEPAAGQCPSPANRTARLPFLDTPVYAAEEPKPRSKEPGKEPEKGLGPDQAKYVQQPVYQSYPTPLWTPPQTAPNLLGIQFTGDGTGRVVASNGSIFERRPGETKWRVLVSTPSALRALDGQWRPNPYEPLCSTCQLRAFSVNGSSAWAIGWAPVDGKQRQDLLFTRDSAGRWWPASRSALQAEEQRKLDEEDQFGRVIQLGPLRLVPPWYLATLLFSLVLSFPALMRPVETRPPDEAEETVEKVLVSDRPLEPTDLDVLGLKTIAQGLSRFLRNERTQPPLTIAINGEWGTGKSSLMNLLRRDLESYGFRPVWFNAWHHQKEEHLLAALLQTIRIDALPPMWQWQGILFRLKLLGYRVRRNAPVLISLIAVLVLIASLELNLISRHGHGFVTWAFELVGNILFPATQTATDTHSPLGSLPLFSSAVALAAALRVLSKGLTAFGAKPGILLSSLTGGQKVRDLNEQSSFRQRFAGEFREVTDALNPNRPLVIFIDDLDRCSPANVLQVLESVNFLVSSGDCFVIIGMARRPVEGAVAFSLKDVAPNMGREPMDFARDYLDKLINIEVPVPRPDKDQAGQLFRSRAGTERAEAPTMELFRYGLRSLQWSVPIFLTALLVWGGMHLGLMLSSPVGDLMEQIDEARKPGKAPAGSSPVAAVAASPPGSVTPGQSPPPPAGTVLPPAVTTSVRPGQAPIASALLALSPSYFIVIALLLTLQIVLTTRPGVVTRDSDSFSAALAIWHPLVLSKQGTPRAAKRFVNRVRFLAMRQGPSRIRVQEWERVLFPNRLDIHIEGSQARIPESLLVALAAIEHVEPAWVYDEVKFDKVMSEPALSLEESVSGTKDLLSKARENHQQHWGPDNWRALARYRLRFLEMWPQIKLR